MFAGLSAGEITGGVAARLPRRLVELAADRHGLECFPTADVEPYFTSEAAGRGPGYVEFRISDYQHELGIIDRRFASPELAAGPGGVVVYWHVDDVAATLDRLVSLGAKQLQALTERSPGSSPPRSSTRSATSWASCTTATTSTSWATAEERGRRPLSDRRRHACRRSLPSTRPW